MILLISVFISFINAFLPKITKKISFCLVQRSENPHKEEILQIVNEIKSISIRQDFPKYARLKRRLNKLSDEKATAENAYKSALGQVSLKITYITQGVMTLLSLLMFWMYRFHPVARLPSEWLYPLDVVLSWPIQASGDISFPVWFLITNSVSKVMAGAFS